jgi:hypothetical protein
MNWIGHSYLNICLEEGAVITILREYRNNSKNVMTVYISSTRWYGPVRYILKSIHRCLRLPRDNMTLEDLEHESEYRINREEFIKANRRKLVTSDVVLRQYERFIVPGLLNWGDIKPTEMAGGVSLCSVGVVSECLNGKMAGSLYVHKKCIHFIPFFPLFDDTNNLSYAISQHCDSNLLTKLNQSLENDLEYIVQVMFSLYKMQTEFKMMHNDLFVHNVLLQNVAPNIKWNRKSICHADHWRYSYIHNGQSKQIFIKRTYHMVKIGEFGFACSYCDVGGVARKDVYTGTYPTLPSRFSPQCDIMSFLNNLFIDFQSVTALICLERICHLFDYICVDEMLSDILVPGDSYRILPDKLEGLDAALLLSEITDIFPTIPTTSDSYITLGR